jgi:hypothetical protein
MEDIQSDEKQRPDYLSQIMSLCTTLSGEAIDAAESKAKANQFDIDRGEIPFTEVGINLISARETLEDSIKKQKLAQLPITVQKELLSNLQSVSKALQGIMNNADEIVNLGNAVEVLNTSIWKYGLHNLSDQVLGYETKLNQLKQQNIRAKSLLTILENGRVMFERLTKLAQNAENATEQISKLRLMAEQEASSTSASRQQAQDELTKVNTSTASAAQAEAQIAQYSSTIKTAVSEIDPLQASIKGFFNEIDAHRRQMAASTDNTSKFLNESSASINNTLSEINSTLTTEIQTNRKAIAELVDQFNVTELELIKKAAASEIKSEQEKHSAFMSIAEEKLTVLETNLKVRSEETIGKNYDDTKNLVAELANLKESVKEQLEQATSFGQFGAFQSRQNTISRGKYLWVMSIGILVACVITLTYYIALQAQQGDLHSAAFWIKLSMNLPLGFLITFCTIQYNRERRLEEEYAFKASVSVSLTPYRELIYSILEKDSVLKDGSYTSFVVDSVKNIFTSPTEKIFDSSKSIEGIPQKALKEAAELLGIAVKAAGGK